MVRISGKHTSSAVVTLTLLLVASGSLAGVEEIPVTTTSESARMDFIAGQAALDRGDGTEANALFRAAIAADPDFAYAWFNLGNAALSTREFADALKRGQAVAAKASDGERMLLEISQRFLDNDFERQLALSTQLVEKYPNSPRAWLNLAGVQGGLNRFDEQRASLKRALEIDPRFVPAHTAMANSYLFNEPKDFERAAKYFRKAIKLQPGEDNYYWGLGDAYRAMGNLELARDYYRRATMLDPADRIAPIKLGHVNSFLGNYDEARVDYDRGIAVAPAANKPVLANYRAFTWAHAGDYDSAVQELQRIARDVDTSDVPSQQRTGAKIFSLTNAATICLHKDMHDDADRMVEELSRLWRANAASVGTEEFSKIQEANIAYWQGRAAARRGDYRAASDLAKKNAELVESEDNPRKMESYHDLMGLIHLRQGEFDKAVEHYRQANLTVMYTKYHLALALEGAGRTDEARALFKEVADWNFNTVGYSLIRRDAIARSS